MLDSLDNINDTVFCENIEILSICLFIYFTYVITVVIVDVVVVVVVVVEYKNIKGDTASSVIIHPSMSLSVCLCHTYVHY